MPAVGREPGEQVAELALTDAHPLREPLVVLERRHARLALGVEKLLTPRRPGGVAPDVPSQRAAVQVREVLDVVQVQAMPCHQGVDRRAGEVAEVLVVDGVELDVLDEVAHVGVLDREDPVVGEQHGEPADEVVEVGYVRHHVVRDDHVGGPVASRIASARSTPKNPTIVGTPIASAAAAGPGAASMPSAGTPAATKLRRR